MKMGAGDLYQALFALTTRKPLLKHRKRRSQTDEGSAGHSGVGRFEEGSHPPSVLWRRLILALQMTRVPQGGPYIGPPYSAVCLLISLEESRAMGLPLLLLLASLQAGEWPEPPWLCLRPWEESLGGAVTGYLEESAGVASQDSHP